jgi:anti-sigma factor RsiW
MSTNPTPEFDCDMVLLVQADFDGELDAGQAATAAAHRAGCAVCQAAYADLARVRESLRAADLYMPAADAFCRRIAGRFGQSPPRFGAWMQTAASFGLGAALAATIALVMARPAPGLIDAVVADHVRSLQPGHLMDVVSTDRHTVKPWFDGRLDFAPPVKDLAAQGFPLEGGRLDYLAGRPVAALVYGRDKHQINLFIWPDNAGAANDVAQRQGYNVVHVSQDGMTLWAVSDLEKAQLDAFIQLWKTAP